MIPRLYEANTTNFESNGIGLLVDAYNWHIVEEYNEDFTCEFDYPADGILTPYLQRGSIIKADASKRLLNQKFRIYKVENDLENMCTHVYARHKSFTLNYDFIPTNINIDTAQSCEYVLNQIFQNSLQHQNYVGYSDILNPQKFNIGYVTPGEAIKGAEGSISDTFGNGVDIVRDNGVEDAIFVLNERGRNSGVLIAYGKNLSGFTSIEDDTDMITRIVPYATYSLGENSEEQAIYHPTTFNYVDADNVDSYDMVYTCYLDFTDKLTENQIPTDEWLLQQSKHYFEANDPNYPKLSYDIQFEQLDIDSIEANNLAALNDVGMRDTVLVWNSKFNIRTETRVIQTDYNPVTEKYNSLILGDPRATLGDILGTDGLKGDKGDKGDQGEKGDTGTGINIIDKLEDTSKLPATGKPGDCYTINGVLYTWSVSSNTWIDIGNIKGEQGDAGESSYLHIKYSDDGITFTANNGETVGIYIGVLVDNIEEDSMNFSDYTWSRIRGDQGLQGLQGEKGEQGIQGPQGEPGENGEDGKTT